MGVKAEVSFIFWGGKKADSIELEKNWTEEKGREGSKHKYKPPVQ